MRYQERDFIGEFERCHGWRGIGTSTDIAAATIVGVAGDVVTTRNRQASGKWTAHDRAFLRGGSGRRRVGSRLWTLLHAQAIIDGTVGPDDAALIEDDRRRLAGRQAR